MLNLGLSSKDSETAIRELKIRRAINKTEIREPGAIEELLRLEGLGEKATVKAYQKMAVDHPIIDKKMVPSTGAQRNNALARLKIFADGDKMCMSVRSGADIGYENPPRIPTGSLMLDWMTGGGYPRAYVTQVKGPENSGKTFAAIQAAKQAQLLGGAVLWVAAERFDKSWARRHGAIIWYSEAELDLLTVEEKKVAIAYNKENPEGQHFIVATGKYGNKLLQLVVEATETNAFDLIVIDSMSALRSEGVLEGKKTGDKTRGGEAVTNNDFCSRLESAFNYVEGMRDKILDRKFKCTYCAGIFDAKKDHRKCPKATSKTKTAKLDSYGEVGESVRTAIIVIGQLRDQGLDGMKRRPDAGGGRGLRHLKALDLDFRYKKPVESTWGGQSVTYGVRTYLEISKSKVCPPHRAGIIEMIVEDFPALGHKAGRYNIATELLGEKFGSGEASFVSTGLLEMSGLIAKHGNWIEINGQKFNGKVQFVKFLSENPIVFKSIVAEVQEWIREGGHRQN